MSNEISTGAGAALGAWKSGSLLLVAALLGLPARAQATTHDVAIQFFRYTGSHIVIAVGDTVRWSNLDGIQHSSTEGTDLVLNGNEAWHHLFNPGSPSFSVTFDAAFLAANPRPDNHYAYFCVPHPGMQGSVRVVDGPGTPFCFCSPNGPCFNPDYGAGCINSDGNRGARMLAQGSASASADDLQLVIDLLPANKLCLLIRGMTSIPPTVLGDGWRCVGSPFYRMGGQSSGPGGMIVRGPGIVASTASSALPISSGETWHFQVWYRDSYSPCAINSNVSNAYTVAFVP
jgi:plastocyanin